MSGRQRRSPCLCRRQSDLKLHIHSDDGRRVEAGDYTVMGRSENLKTNLAFKCQT